MNDAIRLRMDEQAHLIIKEMFDAINAEDFNELMEASMGAIGWMTVMQSVLKEPMA